MLVIGYKKDNLCDLHFTIFYYLGWSERYAGIIKYFSTLKGTYEYSVMYD